MYTMEDWKRDGSLKVKVNQIISNEVAKQLINSVPPTTYCRGLFQVGEPADHEYESLNNGVENPLFDTYKRTNEGWMYLGTCREGETIKRKGYGEWISEQMTSH